MKLEPVEKERIIQHLEPLTIKYFNEFYQCTDSHGIYWEGSHYEHMLEFIRTIKDEGTRDVFVIK